MKNTKIGVYQITCLPTGKVYIGSSVQIHIRWAQHRSSLKRGVSACLHLQRAWTKYGQDAFTFAVLEECATEVLEEREQFYIDTLAPALNLVTSVKRRDSPEIRAKIAAATRARAALITHCPHGHLYDAENTYIGKKGEKICRACNAERVSSIYAAETPEDREVRRAKVRAYNEVNREAIRAKQNARAAMTREQKAAYDRAHRAEFARRRREARAKETPEEAAARRAAKMAAHHRRLGRADGKPPPREPIPAEQRAAISAALKAFNAVNPRPRPPWVEAGVSKTTWHRRQRRAAETPEQVAERRVQRREAYHANIEAEREAMRQRYRRKIEATI